MKNQSRWVRLLWPIFVISHFAIAVLGGGLIGFLPEAFIGQLYHNTGLEAYSPCIAFSALLIGYSLNSGVLDDRVASWTWVLGLLWLGVGVHELTHSWNPTWAPEATAWKYAAANLFGPSDSCGSECFYEFGFTTPFAASVAYSVGAFLRRREIARNGAGHEG